MIESPHDILLTTEGFTAHTELTAHAASKAARLFRHGEPRVDRVRLHLKREAPHSAPPYFAARAIAQNAGPDHVAHAEAPEPETALNAVVEKLERALTATARAHKHRQHHPHAIELEGALPKAE